METKIRVVLEGTGRGLLMHKFDMESYENQVKRSKAAKPTPEEEAEKVAYRLKTPNESEKGQLCLPAEHFIGTLISAGAGFKQVGKGTKTYKAALSGSIDILPDFVGLTNAKGEPLKEYKIDSRPVCIRATKGRIIRHRPLIEAGWRAEFTMVISNDSVSLEVIKAILEEAGKSKCVGDFRPRFGQFSVVSAEIIK
ncbi:MAG: hypothetical protein ACYC3G_01980 [Minisyncoccota bacterium]